MHKSLSAIFLKKIDKTTEKLSESVFVKYSLYSTDLYARRKNKKLISKVLCKRL